MKDTPRVDPCDKIVEVLDNEITDIVLLCTVGAVDTANRFAARAPGATIHVFTERGIPSHRREELAQNVRRYKCGTLGQLRYRLARLPQPQLIVECGRTNPKQKIQTLRALFFFVRAGGAYVMQVPSISRAASEREEILAMLCRTLRGDTGPEASNFSKELVAACGTYSVSATDVVIRKQFAHRFKIADARANSLLDATYGKRWGEIVCERASREWKPAEKTILHGVSLDVRAPEQINQLNFGCEVPPLSLRRYTGVTAWRFQRVALDGHWLPDTFRHHLNARLGHRALISANKAHARLRTGDDQPSRAIDSPCFYFDTEYPGHFGHVMTEVISRYWGWKDAARREPRIVPLVGLADGQEEMPEFQRKMFEALKINVDRVEYISGTEAVRVDSLYAATPAFANPRYVDPDLSEVWGLIAASLREERSTPRLLFVSRRVRDIRSCVNTEEVEDFFEELGFSLFYPEDYSFEHQVTAFHNADVIAGFAGSGMFGLMFAPGKTVILIRPDAYTAVNEALISSVVGAHLHCFWAESEVQQPPRGWSWAAYQANFRFDLNRFRAEIRDIVEGI